MEIYRVTETDKDTGRSESRWRRKLCKGMRKERVERCFM